MTSFPLAIAIGLLLFLVISGMRIIKEYERGVVLRLGKYAGYKEGGLAWIIPFVDQMIKIDMRVITRDVPPQDIITKDNVSVTVNAVLYFRVVHPDKAVLNVEDFMYATSQYAQTTLRSILGQHDMDDLLSEREKLNLLLQDVLDKRTDPWGIKVANVEIKHVDLPQEMRRAMAKQAEAEREKRAKIIAAEGEFIASQKLGEAATVLSNSPNAIQLRYLQTLAEIATEHNSTIVFPIPIELFKGFVHTPDPEKYG